MHLIISMSIPGQTEAAGNNCGYALRKAHESIPDAGLRKKIGRPVRIVL